jgi:hypothetical protein
MTVILPPGVQWVVNLQQLKLAYGDIFTPEFNLKQQIPWELYVGELSESSSTYDMIIVQGEHLFGESSIIMNFNDHTVTWDTDTIPMRDRGTALYHQQRP